METSPNTPNTDFQTKKHALFLGLALIAGIALGMYYQSTVNIANNKTLIFQLNELKKAQLSKNYTVPEIENTKTEFVDKNPCGENGGYNLRFINIGDTCEARLLYENSIDYGYSISYPKNWEVQIRGAAGTSLSFSQDKEELVFIGIAASDGSFDQYDKLTTGFELSPKVPIIWSTDKVHSKETLNVANRKVMKLTATSEKEGEITYYLFDNGLPGMRTVYYLRVSSKVTPEEALNMVKSVEPRFTL